MSTERDWVRSAKTNPAWTTTPERATREDLFLAIDTMWQIGIEHDLHLDSRFVSARTRARALASTLVPKKSRDGFRCESCTCRFHVAADLAAHIETHHREVA